MEKGKKALLAATEISIAAIVLAVIPVRVGIVPGSPLSDRLAYSFCHANIFHAAANVYCLIAVTKAYRISVSGLLTAFLIAVSVPSQMLTDTPTMGLSGLCFALIGMMVWKVRRKLYYNTWAMAFAAVGLIIPNVNAWLHIWCLLTGEAVGFLFAPAPWNRK